MARSPEQHSADSRYAAHVMWSGVADKTERLRNMHDNSPSGYAWHARRLFGADVDVDALTKRQWKQVADARLAWLRANSIKAIKVRQRQTARKLRAEADRLEAAAGDGP